MNVELDEFGVLPALRLPRPGPSPEELQRVVETLRKARKPLLIAGGGVVRSGATVAFRAFLERTGFPAFSTVMGRGVLPPESPLNIGAGGMLAGKVIIEATQAADVVLAIGCKFGTFTPVHKPPHYPKPKDQQIIQIDIDGASIGKSVPVDIGLVGDADTTLRALCGMLPDAAGFHADPQWLETLRAGVDDHRRKVNATAAKKVVGGESLLNEATVTRALSELVPADAITVIDGGQAMVWSTTFIQPDDPDRILSDPGMGHLGFGLPFANAAKLAHPDRPVVCITGDGALGCTVQELETAARYGLNIVVVVLNDSYWGMYKPIADMFQNPNFGARLTTVDFAKVAEGFGCRGQHVKTVADLQAAFGEALASGKPSLIDVAVEYTPHPTDFMWPNIILHGFQFPAPDKIKAVA